MTDEIRVAQVLRFCNDEYGLSVPGQRLQDPRQAPQLPPAMIGMGLITGAALGIESLRQLDRFLRQPAARRLLGSPRPRVASDSTVARVVGTLEAGSVRDVLQAITHGLRGQGEGKLELPDRGRTRVGAVDGSSFGPLHASVFAQLGTLELLEDLEPWEKAGKERPASYRLLRRMVEREGKGFLELVAADGLYATRDFFRFCWEELGCHAVVKTDEETLTLRQDADGLFDASPRRREGIADVEGVEAQRAVAYRIWAASGFEWEGLASPLRIARVGEEPLKGPHRGETSLFDVLPTDLALSARDLREVAPARWREENKGFKALNEQGHAKHAFVREPGALARLVLLLFLAFVLLQASRLRVEAGKAPLGLAPAWEPIAFRFLRQLLWISLGRMQPVGGG